MPESHFPLLIPLLFSPGRFGASGLFRDHIAQDIDL